MESGDTSEAVGGDGNRKSPIDVAHLSVRGVGRFGREPRQDLRQDGGVIEGEVVGQVVEREPAGGGCVVAGGRRNGVF